MQVQENERSADARTAPRSNMYIAGILCWAGSSTPAKIRNMSGSGALIEAAIIPAKNMPVRLVRGSLSAEGRVAWVEEGRCGLHFDAHISVRDWMAPARNSEQSRVDQTVAMLKAGTLPLHESRREKESESAGDAHALEDQLAPDLREVCRLLEILGSELSGDDDVVRRHESALQSLDIAAQTIAAAIDLLACGCTAKGDLAHRLASLRTSRKEVLGDCG